MKQETNPIKLFEKYYFPERPYVSKDLIKGVYRVSRVKALSPQFQYIEINHTRFRNAIVIDLDVDDADTYVNNNIERGLPSPNIIIMNPWTTHCHALFFIEGFVDMSIPKQKVWFENVRKSLTVRWGGDMSYANKFIRSPYYHPSYVLTDKPYRLKDLYVKVPHVSIQASPEAKADTAGYVGRNDYLFNVTREFGYKFISKVNYDPKSLRSGLLSYALQENMSGNFSVPLGEAEVKRISRSVASFIEYKFDKDTFTRIQSCRARKRWNMQVTLDAESVVAAKESGMTFREIAEAFKVSESTVKSSYYRHVAKKDIVR